MPEYLTQGQTGSPARPSPIIWDEERKEILSRLERLEAYEHEAKVDMLARLDKLELQTETIAQELATLITWAKQLKRQPTVFT